MRAVIVALVAALGVACGDTTGPEDVPGTYTLHTVNGSHSPFWTTTLPFRVVTVDGRDLVAQQTVAFVSGSLQLNDDATCSATDVERITEVLFDPITMNEVSSTVTAHPSTRSCTFSVTDTSITVTEAFREYTGSISGAVLTLVSQGTTRVYRR
jgi:hypothetical protein